MLFNNDFIKNKISDLKKKYITKPLVKLVLTYAIYEDELKLWRGEVEVKIKTVDGKIITIKDKNKVLLGGLQKLVQHIWGCPQVFQINSFEYELYNQPNVFENQYADIVPDSTSDDIIRCFNLIKSVDNSGAEVEYPRHKDGIDNFANLIPFRVIPLASNKYEDYKPLYAHSRIVTKDGNQYVEYYSKYITDFTARAELANGDIVPDYPNVNLTTDLDSRMATEFFVKLDPVELTEYFSLYVNQGSSATNYSGIGTVMGKLGKISLLNSTTGQMQDFDTMWDSVIFSRVGHISVTNGVDSSIDSKYNTIYV